mmetsp:Transcript_11782/g.18956  ORF Transcript_11782/g.18956 Transcript_11782/m.18956 type:complete len:271 (+) Transcript_11782:1166-1978(+)
MERYKYLCFYSRRTSSLLAQSMLLARTSFHSFCRLEGWLVRHALLFELMSRQAQWSATIVCLYDATKADRFLCVSARLSRGHYLDRLAFTSTHVRRSRAAWSAWSGVARLVRKHHAGPLQGSKERRGVDVDVTLGTENARFCRAIPYLLYSSPPSIQKGLHRVTRGFMKRALEMLRMGMKPVFVFDGGRAPQKDARNEDRQARRAIRCDAYENGVEGAEGSAASTRNLRASVSITDEMVSAVVQALRQHGLAYYIGPLEADGRPRGQLVV